MRIQNLSLSAIGLLFLSTAQFVVRADPVPLENDLTLDESYSESYLAPFAKDDDLEPEFELIDDDDDDEVKMVTLRRRGNDCTKYYTVNRGDTCTQIAGKFDIAVNKFFEWNSQVNKKCDNLYPGKKYCVNYSSSGGSSSSGSSPSSSKSNDCKKKHQVTSSDTCTTVANDFGITRDQFYDMNPQVDRKTCNNLITGKWYCIQSGTSVAKDSDDFDLDQKVTSFASKTKKPAKKKTNTKKKSSSGSNSKVTASSKSKEQRKRIQSGAALTYYWIAHPGDYSSSGKKVEIKTCAGKTIASVPQKYADALVMEGTGVVGNKIVNLGGCACKNYRCFMELNKKEDPYGLTSHGSALRPYITIAANDIKRNTKIYVPALDGASVPGSNESWSFTSRHIDLYVYKVQNYQTLKKNGIKKVDIYEGGNCNLQNYM
ncbi:hypothetical protein DFQ28_003393 [Apophysomyces sp. BC1034]|nr:hypothetical protein DFQ30_006480 [Apophysomyces sp. BC1015]KAG0176908.1 hypothetical protein DFQ29_005479 [Apophysomyces sp. BC1021]KAG0189436.1 hypothetical protein DFQ28_003393 [Apophysomyces sp. BC1034]